MKKSSKAWDAFRSPGTSGATWWMDTDTIKWMPSGDCGLGSYGENFWTRDGKSEKYYGNIDQKRGNDIPLFMDARWHNFQPGDNPNQRVPHLESHVTLYYTDISQWDTMLAVTMKRHSAGINICFLDASVRRVDADNLWSLQWHKEYTKQNYHNKTTQDMSFLKEGI
ncbi:MAG: hypothetical protein JEZ07_20155 [Phycisphaerae bacterium]|nr:hypothetical protein [Phycisphaerae bacterium]